MIASDHLTVLDAVDVARLPADAKAVAGYVDGMFENADAMRRRFPRLPLLTIATRATSAADCLDVERGDATVVEAAAWLSLMRSQRARHRPCLYMSVGAVPDAVSQLAHLGHPRRTYRLWTAHWTGNAHICSAHCGLGELERPGMTQYFDGSRTGFDQSITTAGWLNAAARGTGLH